MAEREKGRVALRTLLARRVPDEVASAFTNDQLDVLLDRGYTNETYLAGLQPEDLPDPRFLAAVRNLLLLTYRGQAGKPSLWPWSFQV